LWKKLIKNVNEQEGKRGKEGLKREREVGRGRASELRA
jgi:hypothetical protein